MTQLTPSIRRQITEDWHKLFPQLAVYETMWLARRVGPLVQGICLDRDSGAGAYFPTTHLHNLCRHFPAISLSLGQRLLDERSGVQRRIAVQRHEQDHREAAQRLTRASLLPLSGDLTLRQVLDAYRHYGELNRPDSRYPLLLLEDGVLLLAWSGQREQAAGLLMRHMLEMRDWPSYVMAGYGGVDCWEARMLESISNPEKLQITAECEARRLNVADLPAAHLLR